MWMLSSLLLTHFLINATASLSFRHIILLPLQPLGIISVNSLNLLHPHYLAEVPPYVLYWQDRVLLHGIQWSYCADPQVRILLTNSSLCSQLNWMNILQIFKLNYWIILRSAESSFVRAGTCFSFPTVEKRWLLWCVPQSKITLAQFLSLLEVPNLEGTGTFPVCSVELSR